MFVNILFKKSTFNPYDYLRIYSHMVFWFIGGYMPRGFTDKEYQFYKDKLLSVGERLFSQYGLNKVSVEKITSEVGIAKGSFYKFYKNKEDLCYDCLMALEKRIRKDFESEILAKSNTPGELISNLIHIIPLIMKDYPLLAIFQNKDEMENLMLRVDPQKHKDNFTGDMEYFSQVFVGSGITDEEEIKGIISLFWSIVLLTLNKDFVVEESKPLFSLMDKMIFSYFDGKSK